MLFKRTIDIVVSTNCRFVQFLGAKSWVKKWFTPRSTSGPHFGSNF